MVKFCQSLGVTKMRKEWILCPFCKTRIRKNKALEKMSYGSIRKNKETLEFLTRLENINFGEKAYNCYNCGCAFSDIDVAITNESRPTPITKKEFFDIIFEALCDIFSFKEEDKLKKRRQLEKMYKGIVKTYYKEIAILQAEEFYEVESELKGYHFLKNIMKKEKASSNE